MSQNPLEIQTFEDVQPLDDQLGVFPPKPMPDALYEPLFGQTDPDVPLHTYAILDAAKIANLPDILAGTDLEHRCLFKGKGEEDLGAVGPWIVKLDEDHSLTRSLFTDDPQDDMPWVHWAKDPGIYIRATASLTALWQHFRKFTKFTDKTGKSYFFRFWEPLVADAYLANVAGEDQRFRMFYQTARGEMIHSILCCQSWGRTTLYTANPFTPDPEQRQGFFLTQSDLDAFARATRARHIRLIATDLREDFPDQTQDLNPDSLTAFVAKTIDHMQAHGFQKRQNLRVLAAWELFYGPNFEGKDPDGMLQDICQSCTPETKKFKQLEARITDLHQKELL
ncbi:DUF4123 domain-containing protein [Pseudaestuariivita rosea]|uniref:DUF4123 domain-containing protein n=1 Tax=Pseudaestuariivita rosea TaxID=2763263 RepID=UPI001ABAF9F4|nr:DUF4123 domain-containing protein [Pseudaestuariivita rosea]